MLSNKLSNRQRFIKNFSLLLTSRVISAVLTLLVNILLIKRLGASIYGEFAFALTLSGYFVSISDTGLSPFGETEAAKNKNNIAKIAADITSAKFLLSLISTIIIIFIGIFLFKEDLRQKNMLIAIAFLPLIYSFNFSWALRGIEKNHVILTTNLAGGLIYFLGVLLIVKNPSWYLAAVLLFLAGSIITSAFQFGYIKNLIKKIKVSFSYGSVKKTVKDSLPFGIFSWFSVLYISYPIVFLKIFSDNKNIGLYYITYKLMVFIFVIFNLTGNAFIPIISDAIKAKDNEKESKILSELIKFTYTFSIPVCFGGFVVSNNLITELFGLKIIESAILLRMMVWAIIPVGISSALISYLMTKNAKKSLVKSAMFASIIGFIFSIFFIKYFGLKGAAYSLNFIELLMAGSLIYFTYKIIKIKFDIINFIKVLSASMIMAYAVILAHQRLILSILIGMAVYSALSLILKTITKKDIKKLKGLLTH
ncbi:MAG: oligosaccharide flippase family protein [bacterium]